MTVLEQFEDVVKIKENRLYTLYRAKVRGTSQVRFLKRFGLAGSIHPDRALLKSRYRHVRGMALPHIVNVYDLIEGTEAPAPELIVVYEAVSGISPQAYIEMPGERLKRFLEMAIGMATILNDIHKSGIVHQELRTADFAYLPEEKSLKLVDPVPLLNICPPMASFSSADLEDMTVINGVLPYISPEQTGRMSWAVDYRTDLYSLGIIYYELLTGRPPFVSTEPLELIHAHIARQPVPIQELQPDIPRPLSDIIMRLIEKHPDARFQSVYGVRADLQTCLNQLTKAGVIETFNIARRDVSETLRHPQRLYGREAEIAQLLNGLRTVSQGRSLFTLVAGYAGIGKSCLVATLQQPLAEMGGYFISGKYDQYHHDVPYSAIIKAFQNMIDLILMESEEQIAVWKEHILSAVENNGQLIIDVIPQVELIIGQQPEVVPLPPAKAQTRFMFVFVRFVMAFAQKEHPLALFLDDLQWADAASLKLIGLLADCDVGHFYFLAAYRNNVVEGRALLMETLEMVRHRDGAVANIELNPIHEANVCQLMADIFSRRLDEVADLAGRVQAKTGGNPFFIKQFLAVLNAENIFSYDFNAGRWQWDVDQLHDKAITDNIVDLLSQRTRQLAADIQDVLQIAACIGDQFDLPTIARLSPKGVHNILISLHEAQKIGFIVSMGNLTPPLAPQLPTSHDSQPTPLDEHQDHRVEEFKFAHDRVRQAVYSQISDELKQKTHLEIGRSLLKATPREKMEEHIFDIVKQLNRGTRLLTNQEEVYELAQANLMAGKKAKAAAAFESAYTYFRFGIDLLSRASWQERYDLTLFLYQEGVEAAYLSGRLEQMETLAGILLTQALTLLDKITVYEVQILALKAQYKLKESLQLGLSLLKQLDFHLPQKPNRVHFLRAWLAIKIKLAGKPVEELVNLPRMTDPYKLAALRIVSSIASTAYYTCQELLPLIITRTLQLQLTYGVASEVAFVYAGYGFILSGLLKDIDAGYRFGNLALNALEWPEAEKYKSRTLFMVSAFITHWKVHGRESLVPLEEAHQEGLKTGDLEFAALSAQIYPEYQFFVGKELSGIEKELQALEVTMIKIKHETNLNHNRICRQTILNLMHGAQKGAQAPPWRLSGDVYDETHMLPFHLKANDRSVLSMLYNFKLMLSVLLQAYPQAVDCADKGDLYIDSASGLMNFPLFYFYDSLARLAVFEIVPHRQQKQIRKRVAANQKKMRQWADHAPMNYLNKFYLVEAERARIDQNDAQAAACYNQAISLAYDHGYIQEEALAYELTAKYYLAKKLFKISGVLLNEACLRYSRWGADAVVEVLKSKYADIFVRATVPATASEMNPLHLDSLTVIHSLQAISTDIVLDSLLNNLMKILMETAGASRILFLSLEAQKVCLEAEMSAARDEVTLYNAQQIDTLENVAFIPILNYVQRTSKYKAIENVEKESTFASDPYFQAQRPKSILCLPVLNQSRLTAMLYFENHVAAGAFTPDRIEVLQLLSSQIAISFDNARLYENLCRLEEEVSKRLHTEQIIAAISSSFINLPLDQIDHGIDQALKRIGEFAPEDRCFIFQITSDGKLASETNVWCAGGVKSKADYFQHIPLAEFPWFTNMLNRNRILRISRLDDLPPEAHNLKSVLRRQSIHSFCIVPMVSAGKAIGFLGCSAVRQVKSWDPDTIRLLRTVSEILASACVRKRTALDLDNYQNRLRKLSAELVLAEEKERRRIAVELHDQIGHSLANAMMKLGSARKQAASPFLTTTLEEIRRLLDECIRDTRSLTFDLSPHILYDMGLEAAVDWLVEKTQEDHGLAIVFEDDLQPKPLDDSHRILIYQAIRELLFNIVKHAQAQKAKVRIERKDNRVRVVIADDGVGMDVEGSPSYGNKTGGFGLFSIEERLNSQGGRFEIASEPGRGTRITMVFPIKDAETDDRGAFGRF